MSEKIWRVIPPRDETRAFNIIEFIDDDFGTHIAEVYDEDSVNLIAAAPEMYEMITKLVDGVTMAELLNGRQIIKVNPELVESAKQLLARIDGEEVNHERVHKRQVGIQTRRRQLLDNTIG